MSCRDRPSRPPRRCTPPSWIWTTSWQRSRPRKPSTPPTPPPSNRRRRSWQRSRPRSTRLPPRNTWAGRPDGLDAMLTATSPQGLIDQLAVQRVMASEMSAQMKSYRDLGAQAAQAEAASAKSAADAKTAAEQAAAVRADLQSKQSQLQVQIAIVKSQYEALTPDQREALAAVPPAAARFRRRRRRRRAGRSRDRAPRRRMAFRPAMWRRREGVAPPRGRPTVIQAALSRIGRPYSWGASGPNAFDCSGLVMWSFQQAGISLPHSSQALASGGQPVSMDQIQPGDVVTYYSDASHVGHLHRRRNDGARVDLWHAGAGRAGEQCADLQRSPLLTVSRVPRTRASRQTAAVLLIAELICALLLVGRTDPTPPARLSPRRRRSPRPPRPSTSQTLRDGRTVHLIGLGGRTRTAARAASPARLDDAAGAVTAFWGPDWPREIVDRGRGHRCAVRRGGRRRHPTPRPPPPASASCSPPARPT